MVDFSNKITLITGGARGLGRLMALKMAERGSHVVLWDIDEEGLAGVADEISTAGNKVHNAFLAHLKEKVEALRVGADDDFNVDLGVMTTERRAVKVRSHIEDALAKGGVIYARSGHPEGNGSGNRLPAMVLTEVTHDMVMMQEETFGPMSNCGSREGK